MAKKKETDHKEPVYLSFREKYEKADTLTRKAMIARALGTSYGNLDVVLEHMHTTWEIEGRRLCREMK